MKKKNKFKRAIISRQKGYVVIITTMALITLSFSATLVLFNSAFSEYKAVTYRAGREKSLQLAQSGLETGLMLLTRIPTDQLYNFGVFNNPPTLPLGGGVISISLKEESGKININRLIHFFDDEPDLRTREYLDRLSISMGIPVDVWDAVADYIDENNTASPRGFEMADYSRLNPPRRIKNGRLHSLEELLLIPGFDNTILYEDVRSQESIKRTSLAFATREEQAAISDEDHILANNLTVHLPFTPEAQDKINLNSAPYHVIMALSEFMTPQTAKKILTERLKRGGRYKNTSDLAKIPELNVPSSGGLKLFQEIEGRITLQDQIYKIVAEASIDSQTAHVMAIYDPVSRKITFYSE